MSYLTQKTIKNPISFEGIGLHTGLRVIVCIKPAEPDTGIVFKRVDLKTNNLVYPNFMNVSNTSLNTTITNVFGVKLFFFMLGANSVSLKISIMYIFFIKGAEELDRITLTPFWFNF